MLDEPWRICETSEERFPDQTLKLSLSLWWLDRTVRRVAPEGRYVKF